MPIFDDLSTGGIDTTFGNETVSEVQQEAIQEQIRQVSELMPSVQQILDTIDEEIKAVSDIRSYMHTLPEAPRKEDIEAEYRGRELFIGMAERLKSGIVSKLSMVERELGNG